MYRESEVVVNLMRCSVRLCGTFGTKIASICENLWTGISRLKSLISLGKKLSMFACRSTSYFHAFSSFSPYITESPWKVDSVILFVHTLDEQLSPYNILSV